MENLPENQNENQEFSTIFSAPQEHNDSAPKAKKRGKTVIALCLVVALLIGGTFAVVKFIPEKKTEVGGIGSIEVLSLDSDNISKMTVKNQNGNFQFYSKEEKSTSSDTGDTVTTTEWYAKGYDKGMMSGDSISGIIDQVIDIDAIREITEKSEKDCGLSKPVVSVEFETADKKKDAVHIGAKSPDNAGVYLKLESTGKIYLVGDYLDESLNFTDLDLASTEAEPGIELPEKYSDYCSGVAVERCDYITVEGVNFAEKMVFKPTSNEQIALFTPFEAIEPVSRAALNVETMFLVFTGGFNVSGAYSYDVKNETLKDLGLDKPDFVLSAIFDDYTYSYKFKQQKDGDYAVVGNDSKNVKKVSLTDCGFLAYGTNDLYNQIVFMAMIDDVANLTFETADNTYSFDIEANPSGDDTNKYNVTMGKKKFKSSYFQSFYQYLCSLEAMDFETKEVNDKPELTITYTYSDKKTQPTVITFTKESAVRYQYTVDGVKMGVIGSSDYTKILKNLNRLLEGKQIVVN